MAVKEKTDCGDEMEWSAEEELQLFKALGGLKPFGINKHFYMACICERLSDALKREIYPDVVWAHLKTMYNLEILDQIQPLPFPQNQCDFSLPDDDFSHLMSKKLQEIKGHEDGEGGSSSSTSVQTIVKSRTSTPQPSQSNPISATLVSQSNTALPTTTNTATATMVGSSSSLSASKTGGSSTAITKLQSSIAGMSSSSTSSTPNTQSAIQSRTSSQSSNASYKSLTQQNDNQILNGVGDISSQNLLNSASSLNSNVTGGGSGNNSSNSGGTSNNNGNGKSVSTSANNTVNQKEFEKKITAKLASLEIPKRTTKRTRGSMSIESNSPSTTPPPTQTKRRRI